MELKKVSSAGDPLVVERNRRSIDPLLPSMVAVSIQLLTTVYMYLTNEPAKSVAASGIVTAAYAALGYMLVRKPKTKKPI